MTWADKLEGKKQQAKRLMDKLPGPTPTLWYYVGGSDFPKKESKELWDYIESLQKKVKQDEKNN
ncbi:hypothetical protein [Candidatus Enterococcus clewellii]|uniref:Uncharacterized protein n=1 Tax=Candidatus Enterococcus clewellii TaxID=1834193 RepID=A0A242K920_9ENTE|nr:hypothetical protein [Enterococcus sp. 9E7_DIV0242]OTP17569.1 hypothetical protein A5888_001707 [Enterococcus sp. 9E7_DIV0242]